MDRHELHINEVKVLSILGHGDNVNPVAEKSPK
jgi:hypothetical protein